MSTWTQTPGDRSAWREAATVAVRRIAAVLLMLVLVLSGFWLRVAVAIDGFLRGLSRLQRAPPPPREVVQPVRALLHAVVALRRGVGAGARALSALSSRLVSVSARADASLHRRRVAVAPG